MVQVYERLSEVEDPLPIATRGLCARLLGESGSQGVVRDAGERELPGAGEPLQFLEDIIVDRERGTHERIMASLSTYPRITRR